MINKSHSDLKNEELTRYSRNIFLKEIGKSGQLKLKQSSILVVGAGGLGSPLLLYLTAMGIGKIKIIEYDTLDLTNLQRQILYKSNQIGKSKADLVLESLTILNPEIDIEVIPEKLEPQNAWSILDNINLVIDGSDNFPTRFLVNDICYYKKIPLLTGGVLQWYGMIMGILPNQTPCYRCIFEEPPENPENCSTVGVLGPFVGVIGSLMAVEAIKILLEIKPNIIGKILRIHAQEMDFRLTNLPKNEKCKICGKNPIINEFNINNPDYYEFCNSTPYFLKTEI